MPKQAVTTRVKSHTKLTDQHPWVELVFRLLGACGTTVVFGIRLVIAEFLFGIMAWAPVRAAGALLAAVPLVYTGKQNFLNLLVSKSPAEALAELSKLVGMGGPFVWFGLRSLDWELGMKAMIGALLFYLALLLLRLLLSQKKVPEKEGGDRSPWWPDVMGGAIPSTRDLRWFTSQRRPPAERWQTAFDQMNCEWIAENRRRNRHIAGKAEFNFAIVVLLLTNTTLLGFEVDDARSLVIGDKFAFVMLELFFATTFIVEWLIRVDQQRWEFFNHNWNIFDFSLVLMGFNDAMMTAFRPLAGTQLAKAFRVFRGLRVARNVRGVAWLSGLWFIIGGLLDSFNTVSLVAAIAGILIYAIAVAVTAVVPTEANARVLASTEKALLQQILEEFNRQDQEQTGHLCLKEFKKMIRQPNVIGKLSLLGLRVSEAEELFALLDADASGEVSGQELIQGIQQLKGPAKGQDVVYLISIAQKENWRAGCFVLRLQRLNARVDSIQVRLNQIGLRLSKEANYLRNGEKRYEKLTTQAANRELVIKEMDQHRFVHYPELAPQVVQAKQSAAVQDEDDNLLE
ncbi:unnamed protein product [Effrenium voratum]|nr:unnamed protein product [Effrenium voratum]